MLKNEKLPGTPRRIGSPLPNKIIETYQDLLKDRVIGESPDDIIRCEPRWIIFNSKNGYKTPCYAEFTVTNTADFRVAYCIKAKEKLMRVSQNHGILKAGDTLKLMVYLPPADDWPRDIAEYYGKRIKMVVENLKIPEHIQPKTKLESSRMSREIFHYTSTTNPLIRMFTKVNLVILQS